MSDRQDESQYAIRPTTWNKHQDSHEINVAGNEEHEGEASMEDSTEGDAEDRSLRLEEPIVFRQEKAEALAPQAMRPSSAECSRKEIP